MARANLRFDLRDLAAAALDSYRDSHSFGFDRLEGPPAVKRCFSTRQRLPALDHNIAILRVKLDAEANALGEFCSRERGATAEERVVHQFAAARVIENRPPHQFNRFLGGMIKLRFVRSAHDEFRTRRLPNGRVFTGLSNPRCVLFSDIPARLVLIPVVCSSEHRSALVPYDLLRVQKPDPREPVENLARVDAGMPAINHLEAGHQLERLRPIGARVAGDSGLGVAFRPLFHVGGFGRAVLVEPGAVPPLAVQRYSVWWIGCHQPRLAVAEQPRDIQGAGCVAAQYAMLTADP